MLEARLRIVWCSCVHPPAVLRCICPDSTALPRALRVVRVCYVATAQLLKSCFLLSSKSLSSFLCALLLRGSHDTTNTPEVHVEAGGWKPEKKGRRSLWPSVVCRHLSEKEVKSFDFYLSKKSCQINKVGKIDRELPNVINQAAAFGLTRLYEYESWKSIWVTKKIDDCHFTLFCCTFNRLDHRPMIVGFVCPWQN